MLITQFVPGAPIVLKRLPSPIVLVFIASACATVLVQRDCNSAEIDFDTEVIPVLTRHGCNAGACHGAAIGRGGFQLSLFGSRPADDFERIVRALEGRRVNLHRPESSLLLRKATETIEHGGGERFSDDSSAFKTMTQWIRSGAKRNTGRKLVSLDVQPKEVWLDAVDDSVEVTVLASFNDGTQHDVTDLTVLTSEDVESISIDRQQNLLNVHRPGQHLVVSRFLNQVHPIVVGVPIGTSNAPTAKSTSQTGISKHPIDKFIDQKLVRLRIPKSPQSDDYQFARRVWLDIAGRLPSVSELNTFVAESDSDKRERLVDQLLDSKEFPKYWALKWANMLGIDSKQLQPQGADAYQNWIAELFRNDTSWKVAARQMLVSNGDGFTHGPINFLRAANGPDGVAESATRVFMGVRLRCANCHDHPLDRWTQDDYHGLAAVFAKLNRGRIVSDSDRGEVTHPVTGRPATPRIPGTADLNDQANGRLEFADWVTDSNNPYFATAAVNRVWSQLMGRGLIDPVDDIRSTNPASHPELLSWLAGHFAENDYRFRSVIRSICTSETYARSSKTVDGNATDATYYSHSLTRPLESEVVANAIAQVTGVPISYGDGQFDAIALTNNRIPSDVLGILGQCDREAACEAPMQRAGGLSTVLHFLNGQLLNARLDSQSGNLSKWMNDHNDKALVDHLYRATLSRPPSDQESDFWSSQIRSTVGETDSPNPASNRQQFFADVFWGLLTSESFLTNH